jgi:threonine dehydrogenase-like Zn-dependent dehydrogenase
VSSAAVELAREAFGTLKGRTLVLLGAGKMCELAAKLLADEGLGRVIVANRTLESARQMAEKVGGEVVPWIEVAGVIGEADVVLCATGAPTVIAANDLAPTSRSARARWSSSTSRCRAPGIRAARPAGAGHDIDDCTVAQQPRRARRDRGRRARHPTSLRLRPGSGIPLTPGSPAARPDRCGA